MKRALRVYHAGRIPAPIKHSGNVSKGHLHKIIPSKRGCILTDGNTVFEYLGRDGARPSRNTVTWTRRIGGPRSVVAEKAGEAVCQIATVSSKRYQRRTTNADH